jgi:hypothetical protein
MDIDEMLARAAISPNVDVDAFAAGDAFSTGALGVAIDVDKLARTLVAGSGLGPSGPAPQVFLGHAQNAPGVGGPVVTRMTGISRVVYGDAVSFGELLQPEPSTSRVIPWTWGTHGHTHAANSSPQESVLVRVVDSFGAGVTGLDNTDITVRQWQRVGGTISENLASTTVTEDGGGDGWYEIATTSILYLNSPHRLSIEPVDPTYIITPPEYAWTPRPDTSGPPVQDATALVIGVALVAGVADDVGLMLIRPQMF